MDPAQNSGNETQAVPQEEPLLKVCRLCGKIADKMQKCKYCIQNLKTKTYYCSKVCQERHWPMHKIWHKQKNTELGVEELRIHAAKTCEGSTKVPPPQCPHGMTPLMAKCYYGDWKGVEQLLDDGEDALQVDDQGISALFYAMYRGHKQVVQVLLKKSPQELLYVVPPAIEGQTCLHSVCSRGNLDLVELLIHAGGKKLIYAKSVKEGVNCMYPACQQGHAHIVQALLRHGGKEILRTAAKDGTSCLFAASALGHLDVVKLLIKAGGEELIHMAQPDGYTSLKIACYAGHAAVADALAEAGGERLLYAVTTNGLGPFHVACQNGHVDVVRTLLARAGPALISRAPQSFSAACIGGRTEVVRALLDAGGAGLLTRPDLNGNSPLEVAAQHGRIDVIRLILEYPQGRALVSRLDPPDGNTPLMLASFSGTAEAVRLFLAAGNALDQLLRRNVPGVTALYVASRTGQVTAVRELLRAVGKLRPAEARAVLLATNGTDGGTCLHAAAADGHLEVVKALMEFPGADALLPLTKADDGSTALHMAAGLGHTEVVRCLAPRAGRAGLVAVNRFDLTPLGVAAHNGHAQAAAVLVAAAAALPE